MTLLPTPILSGYGSLSRQYSQTDALIPAPAEREAPNALVKNALANMLLFLPVGHFDAQASIASNNALSEKRPNLIFDNRQSEENLALTVNHDQIQMDRFLKDNAIYLKRIAIRAEISGFRKLLYDWDGDDGHVPNEKDIQNAISFIRHIPDLGIDTASTIVAGDGEVGFEWKKPEHYLEISFSEGDISFFGDMPNNGERLLGEAVYDENAIPEKLRQLISAIFRRQV